LKLPEGKHFINLTLDLAFKMVFGDKRNTDILKSLLTYILGLNEDDMRDIKIISEFLNRENEDDYKGIIDIRAELKNGTQIQIEMQVANQYNMDKRSLYYWSGMYYTQLDKNQKYASLRKCISINILAFDYDKTNKPYSRYVLKEYESNDILTDALDIRFIELPKRNEVTDNRLKKWLDLISCTSFDKMLEIAKGDKQMERVAEETYKINSDIDRRVDLERREKFHRDQISLQYEAEMRGELRGETRGKVIGRLEEKKETVLTMWSGGESIQKIEKYVRLSKEEIETILTEEKVK